MPSFTYSDVDSGLKITPDGNVKILYDEDVILQSIRNIIGTMVGDRVRNPIGTSLMAQLFEPMNRDVANDMRRTIMEAIRTYEPRVTFDTVIVRPNFDKNFYEIYMAFEIIELNKRTEFITRIRSLGEGN